MNNEKYNGWTNYATWRINLEIFDGEDFEGQKVDHEHVKNWAEDLIFVDVEPYRFQSPSYRPPLVEDYARAFLSDVNWHEIAEHLNEEIEVAK